MDIRHSRHMKTLFKFSQSQHVGALPSECVVLFRLRRRPWYRDLRTSSKFAQLNCHFQTGAKGVRDVGGEEVGVKCGCMQGCNDLSFAATLRGRESPLNCLEIGGRPWRLWSSYEHVTDRRERQCVAEMYAERNPSCAGSVARRLSAQVHPAFQELTWRVPISTPWSPALTHTHTHPHTLTCTNAHISHVAEEVLWPSCPFFFGLFFSLFFFNRPH